MINNLEAQSFIPERLKTTTAALLGIIALSSLSSSEYRQNEEPNNISNPNQSLNVITIVVDDMNDFPCRDTSKYLPKSSKWLVDQGVCFENATTTTPVCCPARSIIQTGQLAHNNGVLKQTDAENLAIQNTVQYNLSLNGLATYGTGKFLNGVDTQKIAAGETSIGFQEHDFWSDYDYRGFETYDEEGNGTTAPGDVHTTELVGENVQNFINSKTAHNQSFYIYAAYYAPHTQRRKQVDGSSFPQPTEQNASAKVPDFRFEPELDASDKLSIFRSIQDDEAYLTELQQARTRALYDVDDQISAMFETLESQDLIDNTAVFFMSDNGYSLGKHNWTGKAVPYNSSINIPMLAYVPTELESGSIDSRDVGLVDIAPTIYDLYNIESTHTIDGHSLISPYARKDGQFYEFVNDTSRAVKRESGSSALRVPSWQMYRRGEEAYIEYYNADGTVLTQEFYDSPDQLENLLYKQFREQRPSEEKLEQFKQALYRARTCAGTVEMAVENPCS